MENTCSGPCVEPVLAEPSAGVQHPHSVWPPEEMLHLFTTLIQGGATHLVN